MTPSDVLGELAATSPRRLLDELAQLAKALAAAGRARPEVELFLVSGPVLRGRIAKVADTRDGAVVIIATGGSAAAPAVAYVRAESIIAVTVCDASLLVRAPVSDAPAPTKLELARTLAARTDALAAKLGRALPLALGGELDDDGRRAVAALLPALESALAAIAADEMGKAALAQLAQVELGAAASAEVHKDGAKLVVRAPKLLTEMIGAQALREKIEALL